MKSTVEQLSPTRVKINVEVPFDELKTNFDRAYRKLAQQVRIPGFRPGKAPARILENRLGRGVVLDEVVNEAIPAKYSEAISAEQVRPLGQPEIEVTEIKDGEQLAFTAEVDVRPSIELPDASKIAVTVDDVAVADEDVTEQLDALRARFGTLTGVERPAAKDDFVVVDLSATVNGEAVEEAATTGLSYQVGSGGLVDGIDEALVGLSEGESATFSSTLVAGEYANQEAAITATVTAVKERELPAADDEFAQLASEFDTLDELTEDLRTRLGQAKRMQQAAQARDKVLEGLIADTEVPLPESVLKAELDVREHDAIHAFDHDEERFAQWLSEQGKTREEFDTEAKADAEKSVKTQLILDAIADAEEVGVSDMELTQQIVSQAQRFGISPEEFLQRTQQAGQLGAVYADVRRGKALGHVVRQASITDESGTEVDLSEFFGGDESETDAEVETTEQAEATESSEQEPASSKA
ncbi:trigger factor [Pseudonocardia spinosispora]|uniref:trigger factor n=1 Tax=Pseudonocardia spinosispora TaxID=103441 RepID=UPI0003FB44D1|nr:trigger factor [Pseudonocardia spinosispora]